jgi:transcriptional regulator with XRE-family HTH domain
MTPAFETLSELRTAHNMTPADLATAAGMPQDLYKSLEAGKAEQITVGQIRSLAAALDTTPATIILGLNRNIKPTV